ncbi:hypothetical protein ACQP1G_23550 [Nocardia sp. CA-107356]|uniref:hypothetical protein n=1 Tax=Nocardia sp. CA-107356 TaxID=3239972 RepID=UPI003D940D2F
MTERRMRAKGITYDVGFAPGGQSTRPDFDPDIARREIRSIADELQCDAVRISGGDPERLMTAARHAVDVGLEVWFSPFPCELNGDELVPYFADCADRAKAVGAQVFVAGCEMTVFDTGFLPGADTFARLENIMKGDAEVLAGLTEASGRVNAVLAETAAAARKRFDGRLTYASGTWETIDWAPFDIVGVDAYGEPDHPEFRPGLRGYLRHGKPVAITEFGCCTYRGAAPRGGLGWEIADFDTDPPSIRGEYIRDEDEQVRYLRDVFRVAADEGVDTAFWFTFASWTYPHNPDPRFDLDLAAFGVNKVMPDGSLEPKKSFQALAEVCADPTA